MLWAEYELYVSGACEAVTHPGRPGLKAVKRVCCYYTAR